jgi:deoxyribodipyrimidine photo-lyase
MERSISIIWFRRDLRLKDNAALFYALKENTAVLPVFIFDKHILERLEDKYDRRVDFIHQVLTHLNQDLIGLGTSLQVFHGHPKEIFANLVREHKVSKVYANHDYEPSAKARDEEINVLLLSSGIEFKTYKDQCIFEKNEVVKNDDLPYTVFTPYASKWKKQLKPFFYKAYPTERHFGNFLKTPPASVPTLESIGFIKTTILFNKKIVLNEGLIKSYKQQRDYPSVNGTSKLSMHLRFGTISIRTLVARALPLSETWLNELIWRDFYMMILEHFPHVASSSFRKEYDRIPWRNSEKDFELWCRGETGFPLVDAGMRELNTTGFMHNRVRMVVSSFLVKDLLIDWRWGEAYFAKKLNDFDLSANNGGWQWAAGCGCDAAPYFRVFNPTEQQKKFDPDCAYIKKWAPEFRDPSYPKPIVDHASARLRVIDVYKRALNEARQTQLF